MKASIKVLPFVLIAGMTHQVTQAETKQAEDSQSPKQVIAVMSSGIIGGLLAGPIGFFVAAIGADLLLDKESSIVKETLLDENMKTLMTIEPLVVPSVDLVQVLPMQSLKQTITLNTVTAIDEVTIETTEPTLLSHLRLL